ncbi:MAG: 1-acyl-sn-glycerol-3-phosphate acyltransferase [Spirochaetaceae bacterium]|nr:1-acyl-sn-glycerol-3-phosphate acyltransferase [Spirochaetaceae bacterium]
MKANLTNFDEIIKRFSLNNFITEGGQVIDIHHEKKLSFPKAFSFYKEFLQVVLSLRKDILKEQWSEELFIQSCFQIIKIVEKYGGRFEIKGLDNLRKEPGPFVFVGNHMSTLETLIFPAVIGSIVNVTYVVKQSLITNSIFGHIMRTRNPIAVERKEPKKDLDIVLTKGTEILSGGRSILIFPQSTRVAFFEPEKFNSLGIKLAKRAGVYVIPIALKTDFWENGKLLSTIGNIYPNRTVRIEFGAPVKINGAGKKEHEQIIAFIQSCFDSWK